MICDIMQGLLIIAVVLTLPVSIYCGRVSLQKRKEMFELTKIDKLFYGFADSSVILILFLIGIYLFAIPVQWTCV